ncbi:hypothetical protein BGW38_010268 [Lunasporangiospora selenospora]|uniref:Homeobox domain-containing protein n=1 Tax=Lunasporangiospora selenospora TaxID=979761 RepID=A0A9P6KFT4_9FUNG|nr:hypothetical protein BGW38_010268 [Lunasporangiospora selenospora]
MQLPMSPPLSQEPQEFPETSFALDTLEATTKDTCVDDFVEDLSREPARLMSPPHQQPHQLQQCDLLDSGEKSPSSPKKSLNWVNSHPSHFDAASPTCQPRKRRRRTNREELEILEDAFSRNLLPDAATRQELGERLGMSVRAVQIWFQNRRQSLRKKSISAGGTTGIHKSSSDEEHALHRHLKSSSSSSSSDDGDCVLHIAGTGTRKWDKRRSSGGLSILSNVSEQSLQTVEGPSKRVSRSCSNLNLNASTANSATFTRFDTCSSLPSALTFASRPAAEPSSGSATAQESSFRGYPLPSNYPDVNTRDLKVDGYRYHEDIVDIKQEPMDMMLNFGSNCKTERTTSTIKVDSKAVDLHLSMLLQEARKISEDSGKKVKAAAPMMGLWPRPSDKSILNSFDDSGKNGPTTATIPLPTGNRTLSAPLIRSSNKPRGLGSSGSYHSTQGPTRCVSQRDIPKGSSLLDQHCSTISVQRSPYPRTLSLMERVLDRHRYQEQEEEDCKDTSRRYPRHCRHSFQPLVSRPSQQSLPVASFRQSALSHSGRHPIHKAVTLSSTTPHISASIAPSRTSRPFFINHPSTTDLSTMQMARRLRYMVNKGLKRVQSESALTQRTSSIAGPASRRGQVAMRARRLSIGKSLFDSDSEDVNEDTRIVGANSISTEQPSRPNTLPRQDPEESRILTPHAQKRRARVADARSFDRQHERSAGETDYDDEATDEEDFTIMDERVRKRWSGSRGSEDAQVRLKEPLSEGATAAFDASTIRAPAPLGPKSFLWNSSPQKKMALAQDNDLKNPVYASMPESVSVAMLTQCMQDKDRPGHAKGCAKPAVPLITFDREKVYEKDTEHTGEAHLMSSTASSPTFAVPQSPSLSSLSSPPPQLHLAPCPAQAIMSWSKEEDTVSGDNGLNLDELECASVLAGLGWGR